MAKKSRGAEMVARATITSTNHTTTVIKEVKAEPDKGHQPKMRKPGDLDWTAPRPTELEAEKPDGTRLRIKQSVGRLGAEDSFWYCYHWPVEKDANGGGWRYLGIEKTLELAKSRARSGRMRMPAAELGELIEKYRGTMPDDLYEAEKARFEEWKKNGDHKKLTEAIPPAGGGLIAPGPVELAGKARRKRGALDSGDAVVRAKPEKAAPAARSGRPSQTAVVRVVKRDPTGKPNTKWRTRQEHVFSMDGKTVGDVRDNDAVSHMLRDGTITLEEK